MIGTFNDGMFSDGRFSDGAFSGGTFCMWLFFIFYLFYVSEPLVTVLIRIYPFFNVDPCGSGSETLVRGQPSLNCDCIVGKGRS